MSPITGDDMHKLCVICLGAEQARFSSLLLALFLISILRCRDYEGIAQSPLTHRIVTEGLCEHGYEKMPWV